MFLANDRSWDSPPEPVPFPVADEVHLWRVRLSEEREQPWRDLLTADERQRADRFCFADTRHQFTVTRGILRALLGCYVGAAPTSLCLACNPFGKPFLAGSQPPTGISFNVAHSGGCSLLAFGQGTELGVDIEQTQVNRDVDDLAKAVLSPLEYASWLALPGWGRRRAFFETWTRKEAVVKALGGGLSLLLGRSEAEIISAAQWTLRNLEVGDGYAAALAVRAPHVDVRLWDWRRDGGGNAAL
jgi:4'-phosphopantetheinyl transferase